MMLTLSVSVITQKHKQNQKKKTKKNNNKKKTKNTKQTKQNNKHKQLLECCVQNCGLSFHLKLAEPSFMEGYIKLIKVSEEQ